MITTEKYLNSISPDGDFTCVNSKHLAKIDIFRIHVYITLGQVPKHLVTGIWVNIGPGNDMVESDNSLLPDPLLTHIYVTIGHH